MDDTTWKTLDSRTAAVPNVRLNSLLTPIRERHELPGLMGAIVKNRNIVAIGAVGLRNTTSSEPPKSSFGLIATER